MDSVDEKLPPPLKTNVETQDLPQKHPDGRILNPDDADEAMKAFAGLEGQVITIDAETNRRLLRIIDWHMMPLMCCVYGLNFLDSAEKPFLSQIVDYFSCRIDADALFRRNNIVVRKCHGDSSRYPS
jgi:MFS transporter, ACS family, DAL5 transporter family protein